MEWKRCGCIDDTYNLVELMGAFLPVRFMEVVCV